MEGGNVGLTLRRIHLTQLVPTGALIRFSLPPPSPNRPLSSDTEVLQALTPAYIQTIIPAPTSSSRSPSPTPSTSSSTISSSLITSPDAFAPAAAATEHPTTLLATLEFPLGVTVQVELVGEGDRVGEKVREKIEGQSLGGYVCALLCGRSEAVR